MKYIEQMLSDFPNAKIIHLIRDPRENFGSLRGQFLRTYGRKTHRRPEIGNLYVYSARTSLIPAFRKAIEFSSSHPENFRVIRYEDLTSQPEVVISDLSRWLGIAEDPNLRRPSFGGKAWGGNSSRDQKFDKIAKQDRKWTDTLSSWDVKFAEFLVYDEM